MFTSSPRTSIVRIILALMPTLLAGGVAAQTVTYRLDTVSIESVASEAKVNGMNNLGVVIGSLTRSPSGDRVGFMYDTLGVLGPRGALYLLPNLMADAVGPDASEWESSSVIGINDQGQIVGSFSKSVDGVSETRGFAMDLSATPWSWRYLPVPDANAPELYGARINDNGDVLAYYWYWFGSEGAYREGAYLWNIADDVSQYKLLSYPNGSPIELQGNVLDLNNLGQVSGHTSSGWFRLTTDGTGETIELEFLSSELSRIEAINDFGVVCGWGARPTGKRTTTRTGCRYDTRIDYILDSKSAVDINNSSDVAVEIPFTGGRPYLYHARDGLLSIDNMLSPTTPEADRKFWTAARVIADRINERDATGYPQMAGQALLATTTGSGKTKVTTYDRRIFILTPEMTP